LFLDGGGQGAGDGKLQIAFHGIDAKPGVLPRLIMQLHDRNWFLIVKRGSLEVVRMHYTCFGLHTQTLHLCSPGIWSPPTSQISNNC
jgi:hypothetical protein